MGGALTQLAAYGAQDVYLTGDPQMSFWKENFTRSRGDGYGVDTEPMRRDDLGSAESDDVLSFTSKRTAVVFASAVLLAAVSFYMTRNIKLSLFILVAIGAMFAFIR